MSPEDYTLYFKIKKELWTEFIGKYDETKATAESNLIAFRNVILKYFSEKIREKEKHSSNSSDNTKSS